MGLTNQELSQLVLDMAKREDETNFDEQQYLRQIREIITKGKVRGDRTGTGTFSIFGMQARYNLRNGENI